MSQKAGMCIDPPSAYADVTHNCCHEASSKAFLHPLLPIVLLPRLITSPAAAQVPYHHNSGTNEWKRNKLQWKWHLCNDLVHFSDLVLFVQGRLQRWSFFASDYMSMIFIVSARPSGPIILTMVVNNWSSDTMVPLKFFLLKSGSQSSRDQNFHDDVLDCDDDQGGCKSKEPVTQEQRGEILSVGINALEESGFWC